MSPLGLIDLVHRTEVTARATVRLVVLWAATGCGVLLGVAWLRQRREWRR